MSAQGPEHLPSHAHSVSSSVLDSSDDVNLHRPSLWSDSGSGTPDIVLQGDTDIPRKDTLHPAIEDLEVDPGCCGKQGYVYPFKVKLEERYPMKNPATYTEFEKRYPPDRFGEEASDNSRVWKLYRDRVTERDEDQIESWNKTLDILLIFAGLFSAVATAFIIESYKQLQPDYTEIMVKTFIASLNGTAAVELADFSHFSRPPLARCVNTLWFLSLTLALVVALLAILAKQWLGEYTSRMRRHIGSQRRWVWRHLVYNSGLEKWGMDAFISALPLILHLSLLLFLVGLVAFLTDLDWVIVAFVLVPTLAVIVFYVGATVAPLWFGDCPTATPILRQGRSAMELLYSEIYGYLFTIRKSISRRLDLQSWREPSFTPTPWRLPAYDEAILLDGRSASRDAAAVVWMITSLPAVEEIEVALDAVGSLDPLKHRQEFHLDSNDIPAGNDILCIGPVLTAAKARFQRLCQGSPSSDAAAVARCIRTFLALPTGQILHLGLYTKSLYSEAYNMLDQWAAIPTHDLHLLCNTFTDILGNDQRRDICDVLVAWTGDSSPVTGETPFLPSSIALSFLRCRMDTPEGAMSMAVIYSTLSASLTSSASDPVRRRTTLNTLHDAVISSTQGLVDIEPVNGRIVISTPQQLHFRAISTIGALWRSLPEDAPVEKRLILFTNLTRLVSTSPGVETLTLEHMPYARGILDMVPYFKAEDGEVVKELIELIRDYLEELTNWSWDAGEVQRRLLELDTKPISETCVMALRLSHEYRRNIFPTSAMAVRHTLLNLLLPGTQGEQPAWRTLCSTSLGGLSAYGARSLANVLAPHLTSLMRHGYNDISLVEEFLGDDRLYNLIGAVQFDHWSAHLAQHARELSRGWWEDTKTRLLSLVADTNDGQPAATSLGFLTGPLDDVVDGSPIVDSSQILTFVKEVDALAKCQGCFYDLTWEESAQGTDDGRRYAHSSLLARAYHRTRKTIARISRRGGSVFTSDTENHELPVTASHPVASHASHTSLARASGSGAV